MSGCARACCRRHGRGVRRHRERHRARLPPARAAGLRRRLSHIIGVSPVPDFAMLFSMGRRICHGAHADLVATRSLDAQADLSGAYLSDRRRAGRGRHRACLSRPGLRRSAGLPRLFRRLADPVRRRGHRQLRKPGAPAGRPRASRTGGRRAQRTADACRTARRRSSSAMGLRRSPAWRWSRWPDGR